MRIVEDLSGEVPDTNTHHWKLAEDSQDSQEEVLMYGYNSARNAKFQEEFGLYKRKVYFNNWAPCEFAQFTDHHGHSALEYDDLFDEIYSICPYTTEWLNSLGLERVYKPVFYPFAKSIIPPPGIQKKYDVIYHGGIHGREHATCLMVMREFNYRYVTMTHHINELTYKCLPLATNVNLSFAQKVEVVAQSKISVCYNLVHVLPPHIPAIKSYKDWQHNTAFKEIDGSNVMPQFKTRFHEAAISHTLNLVQRDPWNIVEKYYEPERDFLYFDDGTDLRRRIQDVLQNWENYQGIIESAYQKSLDYTTDNFVALIREGGSW